MTSAPAPTETRPRLLIVDDTPANIDVLVGFLRDHFELRVATDGTRAMELAGDAPHPDLILLDVMMPGLDGFEVCRRLRATPATQLVPILFLTARQDTDSLVEGFAAGGNDYLTKPFRPEELLARVQAHLLIQTQRRALAQKAQQLEELIRIVSHDVANHLAVLSMSLDLVTADPAHDVSDYLPMMQVAVRNGIDLTAMVRQLRQAEDSALPLEPVALRPCVEEAALLLAPRLQAKRITLSVQVPDVSVLALRPALINSVIVNLLTNAIKFSFAGGTVALTAARDGDGITLTVSDHGIGMSASVLARLFNIGRSQSRRGTEGEEGTGFGMPLMEQFVRRFGGHVDVRSRDIASATTDHGTDVRVWLPVAPEAS